MSFADILFVMNYVNLCVYSGRISRLQMACNEWVKLVTATPNPVRYQSTMSGVVRDKEISNIRTNC
jgi:hypothetical protein